MRHHHSFGREAISTGLIGAAAVALWFLVIDLLRGRAFMTPSILGQVLLFGQTTPNQEIIYWPAVAAYTGLHVAMFLLFGALLTKLVFLADRHGIFRFAIVMLLFAFMFFAWGVLGMFFTGTQGLFPFWSVLSANALAVVSMGWYLFRHHPALRRGYIREPLGAAPDPVSTGEVR